MPYTIKKQNENNFWHNEIYNKLTLPHDLQTAQLTNSVSSY